MGRTIYAANISHPRSHCWTATNKVARPPSTVCASMDDVFRSEFDEHATQTITHNHRPSFHVFGVPATAETSVSMYNVRLPCVQPAEVYWVRGTTLVRDSQPKFEHARFDGTKAPALATMKVKDGNCLTCLGSQDL